MFVFLQQKCSFISHVADAENLLKEKKESRNILIERNHIFELTVSAAVGAHSTFNRFMLEIFRDVAESMMEGDEKLLSLPRASVV